jgi:hypothetical protein
MFVNLILGLDHLTGTMVVGPAEPRADHTDCSGPWANGGVWRRKEKLHPDWQRPFTLVVMRLEEDTLALGEADETALRGILSV